MSHRKLFLVSFVVLILLGTASAVHAAGPRFWFHDLQSSQFVVYDTSGQVVRTVPFHWNVPVQTLVTPDESRVYFVSRQISAYQWVWVLDVATGATTPLFAADWGWLSGWLPQRPGTFLITGPQGGKILAYDTNTGALSVFQDKDTLAAAVSFNAFRYEGTVSAEGTAVFRVGYNGAGGDSLVLADYCSLDATHSLCNIRLLASPGGGHGMFTNLAAADTIDPTGSAVFYEESLYDGHHRTLFKKDTQSGMQTPVATGGRFLSTTVVDGSVYFTSPGPLGYHLYGCDVTSLSCSNFAVGPDSYFALFAVADPPGGDDQAPTAVLAAPSVVGVGQGFTLTGSQSFDVGGVITKYLWTSLTAPVGNMPVNVPIQTSASTLAVTVSPSAPVPPGQYRFSLVVVDDSGNQSTPDERVVIVADNQNPTAILSAPSVVGVGQGFTLTGSQSFDTGGGVVVQYRWTSLTTAFGTMPVNVPIQTSASTLAVLPSAPVPPGQYRFSLVVVDDSGNQSSPDERVVIVADTQNPTAILSAPSVVGVGQGFTLTGSQSFDTGGGVVAQYRWTSLTTAFGTMPVNVPIQTSASTLAVTVSAPVPPGQYRFRLEVVDDSGNQSTPDERVVIVADTQNPTAILSAPSVVGVGQGFTLTGSQSFDTGGGVVVQYRWTSLTTAFGTMPVNVPIQTSASTLAVLPSAPVPPGQYRFRLTVVDDSGNQSAPDERVVTVVDNQNPTAILNAPSVVGVGQGFTLTGSQSFDTGGGVVVQYRWTSLTTSFGNLPVNVPIQTPTPTLAVTVSAPVPAGQYRFRLVVVDDSGNQSAPDERVVTVVDNQNPTAILNAPSVVGVGQGFTLTGSQSFDTGGGVVVQYRWTSLTTAFGTMPVNVPIQTSASTLAVTVSAPVPAGQYRFRLVVVDDSGNQSTPDERVVIVADNQNPTAILSAPSVVGVGQGFTLTGSQSFDTGGGAVVQYRWTSLTAAFGTMPVNVPIQTSASTLAVTPSAPVPPGVYLFRLTVVDDSGNQSSPAQVAVTVVP